MEYLVQNLVGQLSSPLTPSSSNSSVLINNKQTTVHVKDDENDDYIIICPLSVSGCEENFNKSQLEEHLKICKFRINDTAITERDVESKSMIYYNPLNYIITCPFRIMGCEENFKRSELTEHLKTCEFNINSREIEVNERNLNKKLVIKQAEQERKRRIKKLKFRYNSATEKNDEDDSDLGHEKRKELFKEALKGIEATKTLHKKEKRVSWVIKAAEIEILRRKILNLAIKRNQFYRKYAPKETRKTKKLFRRRDSICSTQSAPSKLGHGNDPPQEKEQVPQVKGKTDEFLFTNSHFKIKQMKKNKETQTDDGVEFDLDVEIERISEFFSRKQDKEKSKIEDIRKDLVQICKNCFSGFKTELTIYGSYGTNLALPGISDLDFVLSVTHKRNSKKNLSFNESQSVLQQNQNHFIKAFRCEMLGKALRSIDVVSDLKVIQTAAVPIIKFIYNLDVSVDISFSDENHKGLKVVSLINRLKPFYPHLHSMTTVLKMLLFKNNLHDPFSGGLTSFALILMILAGLGRCYEQRETKNLNASLVLLDFLKLYGAEFTMKTHAVKFKWFEHDFDDIVPCLIYLTNKRETAIDRKLLILDPFDENNNIARTCFRFTRFQRVLQQFHFNLLTKNNNKKEDTSQVFNGLIDVENFKLVNYF